MSNELNLPDISDAKYKYSVIGCVIIVALTLLLAGFIVWSSYSQSAASIAAIFAMASGVIFSIIFFVIRLPVRDSAASWANNPLIEAIIIFVVQVLVGIVVLWLAKTWGLAP